MSNGAGACTRVSSQQPTRVASPELRSTSATGGGTTRPEPPPSVSRWDRRSAVSLFSLACTTAASRGHGAAVGGMQVPDQSARATRARLEGRIEHRAARALQPSAEADGRQPEAPASTEGDRVADRDRVLAVVPALGGHPLGSSATMSA